MINLIIASPDQDKMRLWLDTLEPLYPVVFLDNIERFLSANKQNENNLLILDASLIAEKNHLSLICQSFNKVLVVNERRNADQKIQYISDGAWGYSDYFVNTKLIVRTIESILNNEVWLERQLIPQLLQGVIARSNLPKNDELNYEALKTLSVLTNREIEVTRMVYHGDDTDSISQALNISNRTVKAHLGAIYRKLNVQDRFRLIVFLKNLDVGRLSNVDDFFKAENSN